MTRDEKLARQAELKAVLDVKTAMRRARDTFRMDDREPILVDLMHRVSDMPVKHRMTGNEAALFVVTMGAPHGQAVRMAAEHLERDIERPRSNVARLLRALEIGGATEHGPLQDRLVERTADLYRRVARRDPDSAEEIARAERRGFGILASKTFSAKLRNVLGPDFEPAAPFGEDALRRHMGKPSLFGKPRNIRTMA